MILTTLTLSLLLLLSVASVVSSAQDQNSLRHHHRRTATIFDTLNEDELGDAIGLFAGPIELVAEHEEFGWLESPLWSEEGNFLLFSDVVWPDEDGVTCGMIWKWNDTDASLSKFVPCSGLIGPGDAPDNIADYIEAGSNGLYWGWNGVGDLILCQHGKHRIARISLDDVNEDGSIDPALVTVLVDSYNGTGLNSPNDMYMYDNKLYFTDPPFGRQLFSVDGQPGAAFDDISQDIGVYYIDGDSVMEDVPVEPTRIINFGDPGSEAWEAPNGVALNHAGDVFVGVTDFADPRFHVFYNEDGELDEEGERVASDYTINNNTNGLPDLNDGVTYSPGLDIFFGSGPAGIYMYNGTTFDLLGFLRVDDLVANNVLGGGYLWMTANKRLLRIPLSEEAAMATEGEGQGGPGPSADGDMEEDDEENLDLEGAPAEESEDEVTISRAFGDGV